jgi:hypothetical protein
MCLSSLGGDAPRQRAGGSLDATPQLAFRADTPSAEAPEFREPHRSRPEGDDISIRPSNATARGQDSIALVLMPRDSQISPSLASAVDRSKIET